MKIYKCIGPTDLEHNTRSGWKLDQVLVCDKGSTIPHQAPNAQNPQPGFYGQSTVGVDSPVVIREPMFLLSKESGLESREKELEAMLNGTNEEHKRSLEAYDVLKRERDTYKEEADRRTKEIGESIAVQRKMMVTKEKLEVDIGKLRNAIGTLRFNEIVGS